MVRNCLHRSGFTEGGFTRTAAAGMSIATADRERRRDRVPAQFTVNGWVSLTRQHAEPLTAPGVIRGRATSLRRLP